MDDFEWLDHTADIGIRVCGKNAVELLSKAATGMFAVMASPLDDHSPFQDPPQLYSLDIQSSDANALMLDWLNELLSLSDVHRVIFTEFKFKELKPNSLKADVRGVSRSQFTMERDIKAVTAHGLAVREVGKLLVVEIIFDV